MNGNKKSWRLTCVFPHCMVILLYSCYEDPTIVEMATLQTTQHSALQSDCLLGRAPGWNIYIKICSFRKSLKITFFTIVLFIVKKL